MVSGLQVSEFEPLADIAIEYRAHLVAKPLLVVAQCRERWNRLDPLLAELYRLRVETAGIFSGLYVTTFYN